MNNSYLKRLDPDAERRWPTILGAREVSNQKVFELEGVLNGPTPLLGPDTELVVFGSLARGEFQEGSDLDWTILVDGPVNADHATDAHAVRARLHENRF